MGTYEVELRRKCGYWTYEWDNGRIEGVLDGYIFKGNWDSNVGKMQFIQNEGIVIIQARKG